MIARVCTSCRAIIPAGTRSGRCVPCERQREQDRGSAASRGYDRTHRALRDDWQDRMDEGERVSCWRCGRAIDPQAWRLGHCDVDGSRYHGPEHVGCNQATCGRVGCPHPSHATSSHL